MLKKLDAEKLWAYALRSLGQRAQSVSEIRGKLRLRAASLEDVEPVLTKLREYGMVDDRRFAESFAQSKLNNQGIGKGRTLQDLRVRRVAPTLAEQTVEKLYAGRDEMELIEAYVRRKWRSADRDGLFGNEKEMAAAFRRLRMAGFSSGNVLKTLKRFAAKPELLDGWEQPEE